jgi:hypothetical protein
MKMKIFLGATAGLLVMFAILSVNVSQKHSEDINLKSITIMAHANAKVNPDCPNGCLVNGTYCYCFKLYEGLREAGATSETDD